MAVQSSVLLTQQKLRHLNILTLHTDFITSLFYMCHDDKHHWLLPLCAVFFFLGSIVVCCPLYLYVWREEWSFWFIWVTWISVVSCFCSANWPSCASKTWNVGHCANFSTQFFHACHNYRHYWSLPFYVMFSGFDLSEDMWLKGSWFQLWCDICA